jgi:cytochrome P450
MPLILEKMEPFWSHLDRFAATNEEFHLEEMIANLTFDVIGVAVLEVQLNAQHLNHSEQDELIRLFRGLLQTYKDDKNNLPWWIVPLSTFKRHRLAKQIDVLVKDKIKHKYAEVKQEVEENRSRSILALSLRDTESLTPQLLSEMSDQVRTFLFAGHDTTSSMLQWLIYELSRTPRALKAVRDELDEILGPQTDPKSICASLVQDGQNLISRMHYTNAVIKETFRLHPPASTVRMTEPGTGFSISTPTGEEYNVDGLIMYSCQKIIQRDPTVFGDNADDWVPERWLGDAAKNIPLGAWRPFERGPRACIGSELANLEARLMIAIVARKYDFVKMGLGANALDKAGRPVLNDQGQFETISELYNVSHLMTFCANNISTVVIC